MKKLSKILVLVLALAMMFTMASMFTASAADTRTIYLNAGGSSLWDQGGAWFAAWAWDDNNNGSWYIFMDTCTEGIYEITVPANVTGLKINRMASGATEPSWTNGDSGYWNQVGEITIGTDNCITITGWNSDSYNLSTIDSCSHDLDTTGACNKCDRDYTYTMVGTLPGLDWNAANSANDMTYADGVYTSKTFTNVPAASYEIKCAENHAWDVSYGDNGSNYKLTLDKVAESLVVKLHRATHKITVEITYPACEHKYELVSSTATCTEAGIATYKCSVDGCEVSYDEAVSALGHHWVNGECDREGCDATTTYTTVTVLADGWTTLNVYTWGDDGYYLTWPGEAMTQETDGRWTYQIPAGYTSFIVNGDKGQTVDITAIPTESALVIVTSETDTSEPPKYLVDIHTEHTWVAGETVKPTYTTTGYTVYSCTCGATENRDETPVLVPEFPTAVVTPIEGKIDDETTLTFALNYGIKGLSVVNGEIVLDPEVFTTEYLNAVLATYGDMYVDFRMTVSGLTSEKVVFNANGIDDGTADGYLAGQYDAWSPNWVSVPFSDVELANGDSLMIMEYAAKSMNQSGLRYKLSEIATIVVDFDCGVYFTPEFLHANPDMKVTLELIVFTEDEEGYKTLLNDAPIAENEFTCEHTLDTGAITTYPTCNTDGVYTQTCTCGKVVTTTLSASENYHDYVLDICYYCYHVRPSIILGENTVVVPEAGSAFGMIKIEEAGTYRISDASNSVVCIFTDSIFATDSDFSITYDEEGNKILGSSWWRFSQVDAELQPGYYYIGVYGEGEHTVTLNRYYDPATCAHKYVYTSCVLCGTLNPNFAYNVMVVGANKVICNEYHHVDTTGHGNPYQFTTFTVTEAGKYRFTSDKEIGFTIYTTALDAPGADWSIPYGTVGSPWNAYIAGNEVELQPGTYNIGLIFTDGQGEYNVTLEKVVEEEPEELNFFERIIAWFVALIQKFLGLFKK